MRRATITVRSDHATLTASDVQVYDVDVEEKRILRDKKSDLFSVSYSGWQKRAFGRMDVGGTEMRSIAVEVNLTARNGAGWVPPPEPTAGPSRIKEEGGIKADPEGADKNVQDGGIPSGPAAVKEEPGNDSGESADVVSDDKNGEWDEEGSGDSSGDDDDWWLFPKSINA